jgi:hypothetical protein
MRVRGLHPGRCPHLLHRGPDAGRGRASSTCCTGLRDFGFEQILIKLSTRPAKRVGATRSGTRPKHPGAALNARGWSGSCSPARAPSTARRSNSRCGLHRRVSGSAARLQVDFSMPDRLGAEYVAEDNSRRTPVMLHRAILGSLERFIGILIEHYAGAHAGLARAGAGGGDEHYRAQAEPVRGGKVAERSLKNQGFRVTESDLRNEKIGFKIREHTIAARSLPPRRRGSGGRNRTVAVRTRRRTRPGRHVDRGFSAICAWPPRSRARPTRWRTEHRCRKKEPDQRRASRR